MAIGLALPVGLAFAWELVVAAGISNGRLLPPPSRIWSELVRLSANGALAEHAAITVWRVASGFVAGAFAGTVLGAITGYWRTAREALDPSLQALRSIPSIAWVPLFILWFGIFETSKVMLIAAGVFFPVYLGVSSALLTVDRKIVEVGRIHRLTPLQTILRILLPSILPAYVTALRTGLGLGWMFVVAAEFMGASAGLGYLLVDGQQLGKPTQIVAAILAFAVLGKLSDALLAAAFVPLLNWQDTHRQEA